VRRRKFIALIAAAGALPFAAGAQQPTKRARVAILSDESPSLGATTFEPFARGLRDLGFIEGQNVAFERRYATEKNEVLPNLAAELVGLQPEVILAIGTPAAWAAKIAWPFLKPSVWVSSGIRVSRPPVRCSKRSQGRLGP
jgi:putative ABC transport system substrate-binding protein